ncbi:MAG TPA: dephospho-CoA kinase [Stellaceae bacterium]|nr:dephospho-CoA kinase [Stellaceae bacterium]
MITIGLTGSIGMGKSTAAAMLRRLGPVMFDADAEVHRLLGAGGAAVAAVEREFPGVRGENGGIDRRLLGARVFGQPEALRRLERILHPIVRAAELRFVARGRARQLPLIVLDIPLLFETRADVLCDAILVVSAPAWLQRQRVLRRPGMSPARLASIVRAQMPDREKRRNADFVVKTGLGRGVTLRHLAGALRILRRGDWRRRPELRRALLARRGG